MYFLYYINDMYIQMYSMRDLSTRLIYIYMCVSVCLWVFVGVCVCVCRCVCACNTQVLTSTRTTSESHIASLRHCLFYPQNRWNISAAQIYVYEVDTSKHCELEMSWNPSESVSKLLIKDIHWEVIQMKSCMYVNRRSRPDV